MTIRRSVGERPVFAHCRRPLGRLWAAAPPEAGSESLDTLGNHSLVLPALAPV